MQIEGGAQAPLHGLPVSRSSLKRLPREKDMNFFIKFLLVICANEEAENTKGTAEPAGSAGKTESRENMTKGLRRSTERKDLCGDDPSGEDDPPKDKIHVRGRYLTFDEFLKERKFTRWTTSARRSRPKQSEWVCWWRPSPLTWKTGKTYLRRSRSRPTTTRP